MNAFFLQTRNKGHGEAFVPGKAQQDPASFQGENGKLFFKGGRVSVSQNEKVLWTDTDEVWQQGECT